MNIIQSPPSPNVATCAEPQDADDGVITRYQKDAFTRRLDRMVEITDGYQGQLDIAWETAVTIAPQDEVAPTSHLLNPNQRRHVETVVSRVVNAGVPSVAIEAAHVYLYEDLDNPALQRDLGAQCIYAAAVTEELRHAGVQEVRQVLFVDDYNPDPQSGAQERRMNVDDLLSFLNSKGYAPDTLLREAAMAPLAEKIIDYMDTQQGLVKVDGGEEELMAEGDDQSRLLLARRNVELYRSGDNMISCAMLDASLTLVKLRNLGEGVINILPRGAGVQGFSYKGQQKKVRTIIGEHLNARVLPMFNLFTGRQPEEEGAAGAHHTLRKPARLTRD